MTVYYIYIYIYFFFCPGDLSWISNGDAQLFYGRSRC